MTETVRATVEAYNIEEEKSYYGLKLDDRSDWVNGQLGAVSPEIVETWKNQELELELNHSSSFIDVEDVRLVEDGGSNSGSRAGSGASSSSGVSRSEQIKVNTAFQQACETVRGSGGKLDVGKHLEQVSKLTNGYYNVLDSQMKDKADNNGGGV